MHDTIESYTWTLEVKELTCMRIESYTWTLEVMELANMHEIAMH